MRNPILRNIGGRFYLPFLIILLLTTVSLRAGDGDGGQSDAYMRYGGSVRAIGLGGAYVSLADDAGVLFYNPAGLTRLKSRHNLYSMFLANADDRRYDFIAAVWPNIALVGDDGIPGIFFGPKATWGIGWLDHTTGGFQRRDEFDHYLGDFDVRERALYLSFARDLLVRPWGILTAGSGLRFTHRGIDTESGGGTGFDVGAQLQLLSPPLIKKAFSLRTLIPIRFGFTYRNLFSKGITLRNTEEKDPGQIRFGMSVAIPNFPDINSRLLVLGDREWLIDTERDGRRYFGIEYQRLFGDIAFAPRIGFNNRNEKWSAGFGLEKSLGGAVVTIDYAYSHQGDLYDDHRFSFNVNLGSLMGTAYHVLKADSAKTNSAKRAEYLQVLSRYDGKDGGGLQEACEALSDTFDESNSKRYDEFLGGLRQARRLHDEVFDVSKETEATSSALSALTAFGLAVMVAVAFAL